MRHLRGSKQTENKEERRNDTNRNDLQKLNPTVSIAMTHTNEKQLDYGTLQRNFINNIYLSDRRDRESVTIFK